MNTGNVLISYAQVAHITKFLTNYCCNNFMKDYFPWTEA
jgi:hypothetical protein